MEITNRGCRGKRRGDAERSRAIVAVALFGALLLCSAPVALAQYGVRRTTVVHGRNRTVVARRTTVVAGGRRTAVVGGRNTTVVVRAGALPHGYIAALPGGYHAVYVSGVRYYTVGGIYYRPQIYASRTVYVRVYI